MKVFVTGGAGFIGSTVARMLLDEGHEVTVYDSLERGSEDNLDKRAIFIKGDIRDQELLEKSLHDMEAVIHFAALTQVAESVENPLMYASNNIIGTLNLLEAMRKAGVKKIIFSSSATVYGVPKTLPLTEDAPISSANPYGASKVACENLIQTYNFNFGFDVVILRYFNPYGPRENHVPETHAIPNFIKSGLKKEPVPLYWKGEQVRDFIYIDDLASAHTAPLQLKGYNVFNVGTEQGVKIIDIVNILSDILGYKLEVKDLGDRPGDVEANYASSKALHEATGWEAKVTIEEGLRKTVEWFKNQV